MLIKIKKDTNNCLSGNCPHKLKSLSGGCIVAGGDQCQDCKFYGSKSKKHNKSQFRGVVKSLKKGLFFCKKGGSVC
jgi:hypothetical protein